MRARALALLFVGLSGCSSVSDRADAFVDDRDDDAAPAPPRCVPGETDLCACTSGTMGAQICDATGSFGACVCDTPDAGACSGEPPTQICVCDGGGVSSRGCFENQWGPCVCPDPPPTCLWFERCNASDDDCDGAIDEGAPCPPGPIVGTMDIPRDVYAVLASSRTEPCALSLSRVWPSEGPSFAVPGAPFGDQCTSRAATETRSVTLAPAHDEVHRGVAGPWPDGAPEVRRGVDGDPDGELVAALPECARSIATLDYDGARHRYVSCDGVWRDGALVARGRLIAVLGSGRMVLYREGVVTLVDPDATERARVDASVLGGLHQVWSASVVPGSAFVAIGRFVDGAAPDVPGPELVIVRFDDDGTITIVRRIPSGTMGTVRTALPLPDGTLVVWRDEANGDLDASEIVALPPDGSVRALFRDVDSPTRALPSIAVLVAVEP